jgi:uroporphyrinogen-III decarboxylase
MKTEKVMTERQRVLTLLAGGRPDRVPWFGDLDYWATALIGRGERPADFKGSDAYIDWHRELRCGFYLQGYFPFRTIVENCRITEWREGAARRKRIETPRGTLTDTWTWLAESFAEAPTEHLVKSAADLAAYRYLFENTRYEPDYGFAEKRRAQVGEAGVVLCYLPKSPFMQMVALDAGIYAVAEIAADAPDELAETLAAVRGAHDRAALIAVASPAEVLMIPENLSSEVVGPRFYERYMRGYHEAWCRAIAAAGKYSCIHLDGTLKGLLRQVASAGFTFIEAMTPAPVGDLPVERWAEWAGAGNRTVFWGGLPGVYFTEQVSDAEFDRHTTAVLEVMRSEPRFVLGVADQVPPDGLERRIRRVAELADEFGRY